MHRQKLIHQLDLIYYPILAAVGVPVNLVAMMILSRGNCGLSQCITRYLVAMSVADLLVVIFDVILYRISYIYFRGSFLDITPVCCLIIVLLNAATDTSVWLTVTFTFDRFVAVCCQKLKTKYCTKETAAVVIVTVCVLSLLKCIPWYFVFGPQYITDNVPWDCIVKQTYFSSFGWAAFAWLHRILTPLLPFALILLLNVLTVRYILVASRARRRLRGHSSGEKDSDPEMKNRRKSIVLLFAISGSFVLLWMTGVLYFLLLRITNAYYYKGPYNPVFILQQTSRMLQLLSCCTNTCIYAVTQTKFRAQLKNAVMYLFTRIRN
ncbi:probable G-protein coupled receptor 139 [Heptranchias perlo]|uniref:probable G-protein coupled receptor 139 n=1 Tax=Heptranchias perlo TaxID=212740 RepID=UPI00355A1D8B